MAQPAPQRQTRQRQAVGEVLAGLEEFRTAQELHDLLREQGHSIGLATVYRNLQAMADAGEVDMVRTPDGQAAYRLCHDDAHHHHLICRNCGKTVEVEFGDFEAMVSALAKQYGFHDVAHEIELFGLCDACVKH